MGRKSLVILLGCLVLVLAYNQCSPPGTVPANSTSSSSNSNGGGGGGNNGGGGGGGPTTAGQIAWQNKVLPQFNARCTGCHTDPRFGGAGPLTIFGYPAMRAKLAVGPSAVNNDLVNKMQSIILHYGGNQCSGGVTTSPCKEVSEWWQAEFTGGGGTTVGVLESVDSSGNVLGWAKDVANPNAAITVFLYADGPVGTGTFVMSLPANLAGPGGAGAGHYFSVQLPANLRNKVAHTLHVYGKEAIAANQLTSSPISYTAYTPTAAGMSYFENTLKPMLQNRCGSCHGTENYTYRYPSLISPSPAQGGTALNNTMINKPSGTVSHGGGNVCGGKNGTPCAQIQQWWNLEFN